MTNPIKLAINIGGQQLEPPPNIPDGPDSLGNIINFGLAILSLVGVLLALFFIAWGGVKWSTSQGDKQKVEAARKMITFSIVGIIVIALSFIILNVVGELLGSPFLIQFGKP